VRFVTKGFSQTFGIDYDDIFSQKIQYDSTWNVLIIVDTKDFDIIQFDIKTTFLTDPNVHLEHSLVDETFVGLFSYS
jgi:hypothetical protein